MNINEMTAGREMDALIAEKVMGYTLSGLSLPAYPKYKLFDIESGEFSGYVKEVPHYSTDIAASWEVVKHMKKQGWSFRFSNNAYADGQNAAAFYRAFRGLGRDILSGLYVYEDKAWAVGGECSAICRAALKAMGVSAIITKPCKPDIFEQTYDLVEE